MSLSIRFEDFIPPKTTEFFTPKAWDHWLQTTLDAQGALYESYRQEYLPMISSAFNEGDLDFLKPHIQHFQNHFKDVIVLGTGGSSLGGRSLVRLKQSPYTKASPKIHFLDNIDPLTFSEIINNFDLKSTGFIIISKSGRTPETITQALSFMECLQKDPNLTNYSERILIITENKETPLKSLANELKIPCFTHPHDIGGRFSVFTLVGCLPALIAGADINRMRQGAQDVFHEFFREDENKVNSPFIKSIAFLVGLYHEHNIDQTVMMPYSDALLPFAEWFAQLWGESLGKDGKGLTPLKALGTVDQHSQLQLYLDGPKNKLVNIIDVRHPSPSPMLGETFINHPDLEIFRGKNLSKLIQAECQATFQSLVNHHRPVRKFEIGKVDESSCGALMAYWMIETLMVAQMLGLNALNQPAVEESKTLTKDYLSHLVA